MDEDEKKKLWVGWTRDAMVRYEAPDDIKDVEELVDDMANTSIDYANSMLKEYEHKFGNGRPRRRKKRGEPPPEDDDDDDDDDDE